MANGPLVVGIASQIAAKEVCPGSPQRNLEPTNQTLVFEKHNDPLSSWGTDHASKLWVMLSNGET